MVNVVTTRVVVVRDLNKKNKMCCLYIYTEYTHSHTHLFIYIFTHKCLSTHKYMYIYCIYISKVQALSYFSLNQNSLEIIKYLPLKYFNCVNYLKNSLWELHQYTVAGFKPHFHSVITGNCSSVLSKLHWHQFQRGSVPTLQP